MQGKIFFAVWLILLICMLFGIFSRKGRNTAIRMQLGGKVIEDLGELGTSAVSLGEQKIRLLKCQSGTETFYALETRTIFGPGVQFSFVKIDKATLQKIKSLDL